MDLTAECQWYPVPAGTMVELRATGTAAIRFHESSAPIRPATTTWGVLIPRNPDSKVGYDLPDAVVSELVADGMGRFASGQDITAERLNAAAERAAAS